MISTITLCADCRRASVLAGEDLEWDFLNDLGAACNRCGGAEALAGVRPRRADEVHAVVSPANLPYSIATYMATPAGADEQTLDPWEANFNEQAQTCPCLYFGDEAPLCVQRGGCQGWAPYPVAAGPAPVDPLDGCVRCAEPAGLTIRIGSGDMLRLCQPCFDTHYERNEDCKTSWEVIED